MPDDAPAEEYLELAGGRVHLFRGGQGEPLLFLHAAGGAGEWNEFHRLLAGAGFGVIAPDHPGFGKTDDFPEVEAIDNLVYHYLDVIEALGLDRVHVVGASFGGWIAAELAVAAPSAAGSLVLLSAAGLRLPGHPVPDIFAMTPDQLTATLFHHPPPAPHHPPPAPHHPPPAPHHPPPAPHHPPPAPPPPAVPAEPDIDAILAAYRDASALARFCWAPYLCDPKLERRLHRIKAPTLVVAPSDDRLIPVAHARRYAERIGGARYTEVADCGHAMYFERPAEFAGITADFLAGHRLGLPNGVSR